MSDESIDYTPRPGRGRKARASTPPPARRQGSEERAVDYAPRPAREARGPRSQAGRSAGRKAATRSGGGGIKKLMRNKVFWQFAAVAALLLIVVVPVIAELLQSGSTVTSSDPVGQGNDYYDQGVTLVQQGDASGALTAFRQAASAYERALLQDPSNVEVRTDLGAVYFYQGRILSDTVMLQRAVQAWETALEYSPDKIESLFNLGLGYAELGQIDAAVVAWQRVIALDPTSQSAADAQTMIDEYTQPPVPVPVGP